LVPHDVTEAEPFPLHHTIDGTIGRAPGAAPLPASDGIRVPGYPGNSVLDGKYLYVAGTLSEDNTATPACPTNQPACGRISILDVTRKPRVIRSESVRPIEGIPVGAHPDALALSPDGGTLFVALAGMNAVEIRDGRTGARVAGKPMYIPTGWYPSALLVTGTRDHYRLWVANAKGAGASTKGTGYNFSIGQ